MFYCPATYFAKASILLSYSRLFAPAKWFRYSVWFTHAFAFCLYWAYIAVNASLCAPGPGQGWLFPGVLAKCEKQQIYVIVQGAGNIAVDLVILFAPIPIVAQLNMRRCKKIAVMSVFGTGGM